MGNKGKRFAFVAIVLVLALGVAVYFYKELPNPNYDPPKPPGSSASSSIPLGGSDSSGDGTTPPNPDYKSPTTKVTPTKSAYPAGVTPVQNVTADMKGQKVTVMGYAVKMTKGKGHHFYIFRDMIEPGSIKAVVFKAESDNQAVDVPLKNSLNTGSLVTLSGKVDIYKGELEIIVNRASE